MAFYDSVGGLQDLNKMLASALSGMGLDGEEVKDIITDPGMQSLLMALGMPEKEALKLVESDDFQLKPLYNAILTHSQRMGFSALNWVKNHPMEFFDGFCTVANIASFVPIPVVALLGNTGNRICLVGKAVQHLPKIQAYFSKQHTSKPSGASTTVGSGSSKASSSSASSAAVPVNKKGVVTEPSSIQDQMTWDLAKRGGGLKLDLPIQDKKYIGWEKFHVKVESANGKESIVHYLRNPKTGEMAQFKFKKRTCDPVTVKPDKK